MYPRQFYASLLIGLMLLILIIRLIQRGRLDIAYCWLWLGLAIGTLLIVIRYDWLLRLSRLIGSLTPTTTLFLFGFTVLMLLCLQFSIVISAHRRQIKKLTQHIALLEQHQSPPGSRNPPGPSETP